MTNTLVTLKDTGIEAAINEGGPYESVRNKMLALDFETQAQEMNVLAGQSDFALGSVHAIAREGTLVIASASGSQLASCSGAGRLRAEQLRGKDPRDPPGAGGPHPRCPHPPARRVLNRRAAYCDTHLEPALREAQL
ncbi:MAG TPA: hypothetical protein VGY32_06925 [Solirubrobacteraceae bacterium]|jgi:hypothetical protein|nr:hypothetical protein [Solirubrobacteraceae bacterium]